MKRFTFIVSGNVQKAGYRDRVIELVSNDETDARLDTAANILKDVIVNMNRGFDKLSNSMETGFNKINTTLDAGFNHLANGQDRMLEKQDDSIKILNNINNDTSEIKSTLKTTEMDIRDARFSLTHLIETKFKEHDADIARIKTTLAKVQEAIKAT
jgi:hypothetical protein